MNEAVPFSETVPPERGIVALPLSFKYTFSFFSLSLFLRAFYALPSRRLSRVGEQLTHVIRA